MKNVPHQTKIAEENKKCASVAHYGIELPCLPCIWPYVALYGLVWPFYGLKWDFMVFYGRISFFLVVIDPNSFGLVNTGRLINSS